MPANCHGFPERAASVILARAQDASLASRSQLLDLLRTRASPELEAQLWDWYDSADDHLRGRILDTLLAHNSARAKALLPEMLASANPRLRATAIRGALTVGSEEEQRLAMIAWHELLDIKGSGAWLAALELVDLLEQPERQDSALLDAYRSVLVELLGSGAARSGRDSNVVRA